MTCFQILNKGLKYPLQNFLYSNLLSIQKYTGTDFISSLGAGKIWNQDISIIPIPAMYLEFEKSWSPFQ